MASGSYLVDNSAWPMLVVTCRGEVDDAEFGRYIESLKNILARESRYVTLLDARAAGPPSVNQRRLQTQFQMDYAPALRAHCAGVAFVMNSTLLRGVLNAIMWMAKPPFPYSVVETPEQARVWLQSQMLQPTALLGDANQRLSRLDS